MKLRHLCFVSLLAVSPATMAADLDLTGFTPDNFKELSKNLSAALSYKAVAPAEPLGVPGFDVALEASSTEIGKSAVLDEAFDGDAPSSLIIPKLHAHLGLPFGFDIGAMLSTVPGSNISLVGAELRYAILEGTTVTPAVAIRGTVSSLNGVDTLDYSSKGVELSISKGFVMLTPYAGIGQVWSDVETTGDAAGIGKEDVSQTKMYLGLNINLGLMNIGLEGDKTGDYMTYSGKLGLRF